MPPKAKSKAGAKVQAKAGAKAKPKAKSKSKAHEEIATLFRKFDTEGTGSIDRAKLNTVLQKCGLSEADTDRLTGEMDRNVDGIVDYEEFLDWVLAGSEDSKMVVALGHIALSVMTMSGDVVFEAELPENLSIAGLKQQVQKASGISVALMKLVWQGEVVVDSSSLLALGLPVKGAMLQLIRLEKPTLDLPSELKVDNELVPQRAVFQLQDDERCVEIAFYGLTNWHNNSPYFLVQYAAEPDWQVRQGCGYVTGYAKWLIDGVCWEGSPGTLPPANRVECTLFYAGGTGVTFKKQYDCWGMLTRIGVQKPLKGFGVPLVQGDENLLDELMGCG
eukprot:gnl/MRDRNA2_/MRDRNA2_212832_c0_seq1.p1 gnl/MRDRNA2_/MRDRNA2_212832_c0~~gnl/MRDRNA2_/MRDRNA2_212832_c0_seq1.p1  ORF type:complete len:333 (-),score=77.18 gnl/MRDRNA2_/MRDRNA2_212832_c0_seq1:5-1003(-)